MRLENSFEVAAPVDAAWKLLNDVPAVLPCMPGAELIETVGENAWKAKLRVKLGPISMRFLADITREVVDETTWRIVLVTRAREANGRGSADARIESSVTPAGEGTTVDLVTDVKLRGAVAQYGRGVVASVASTLTTQFADCLGRKLSAEAGETANAAAPAAPAPVKAFRLEVMALLRSFLGVRQVFRSGRR
jgi:carbon monoxide dehydrogenase subunit G